MQPLSVVVRIMSLDGKTPLHRSYHRFEDDGKIKPFRDAVKKVYPTSETYVVNVRHATPKPSSPTPKGTLWCPYCAAYRTYPGDEYLGIARCEICGMSTNDFHVKTFNQLWPHISQADINRAKKKREDRK